MKPLFTVHIGELVTGGFIERTFRRVNVWVPTKDSGIDLLVTDARNDKTISLQVKSSKDFLPTHFPVFFQKPLRASGWWTLNRQKIASSLAEYWVFVLVSFDRRSTDFVIVPPRELLKRLDAIHGKRKVFQSYFLITERNRCWETRGLKRSEELLIAQGLFSNSKRDFTAYLNNWDPVKKLNR